MDKLVVQPQIFECARCFKTPAEGAYLWERDGDHYCEECREQAPEIPLFEGTLEKLKDITILGNKHEKTTKRPQPPME